MQSLSVEMTQCNEYNSKLLTVNYLIALINKLEHEN